MDAVMAPEGVADPAGTLPVEVPIPAGQRLVTVAVRWQDRGRDPLPFDVLRFTLTDDGGHRTRERFRIPPVRVRQRDGTVRQVARLGFALAPGAHAARLAVDSIITPSPFRAAWKLGPA